MSLSVNPISTGAPTLEWAQAVKRLELAGKGPAEPLADALLEIERLREQLVKAEEWNRLRAEDIITLGQQVGKLETHLSSVRTALGVSIVAIDDWLNLYAGEFCDPKRVEEAQRRVGEYGTVGYIAHVQRQNRAALIDDHQQEKP